MLCGVHLRSAFVQTVGELSEQTRHWFFCRKATTSLSHICILTAAGQIKWEPVIENSTAVVDGTRKWQDSSWCHYLKTDMYSSPPSPGFITWVFLYISFSILYSTPFLITGTNCVPPAPLPLLSYFLLFLICTPKGAVCLWTGESWDSAGLLLALIIRAWQGAALSTCQTNKHPLWYPPGCV